MRTALGFLGCLLAALVAAPMASAACPYEDVQPTEANRDQVRAAVVCLHNEERQAAGVRPLRSNHRLEAAAAGHSADMVARRYFDHDTPDGLDPFERMEASRFIHDDVVWNAGENIAWGSGRLSTARSIFDAWMESPGHRLTLLASEFSQLGVGISLGAPSDQYAHLGNAATYTVDFGWRKRRCGRRTSARRKAGKPRSRGARAKCRYR